MMAKKEEYEGGDENEHVLLGALLNCSYDIVSDEEEKEERKTGPGTYYD